MYAVRFYFCFREIGQMDQIDEICSSLLWLGYVSCKIISEMA